MIRRLALLFGVLLVGAALLEGVARLKCRTDDERRERLLSGEDYWIDRWLAADEARNAPGARRERAETAPLSKSDSIHKHHATLGWVPAENVRLEGISTNWLGMRGKSDVQVGKRPDERRIVVVGDSFTFGEGVTDEEVWTERLAKKLAEQMGDVTVLNLGVAGYGTDQQCLRLEELGMRLHPDLVLVGLFGPDLDRNELTFRDAPKPRFVFEGDGLRLENVPVPTFEELRSRATRTDVVSYAWAMLSKIVAARTADAPDAPKWELARRILDRMRATATAGGARFAIAYFPAKPSSFAANADAYEQTVSEWAASHDVPLFNVRNAYLALGSGRFKDVWHNHWTPFGNQVAADAVLRGLVEFGVLAGH